MGEWVGGGGQCPAQDNEKIETREALGGGMRGDSVRRRPQGLERNRAELDSCVCVCVCMCVCVRARCGGGGGGGCVRAAGRQRAERDQEALRGQWATAAAVYDLAWVRRRAHTHARARAQTHTMQVKRRRVAGGACGGPASGGVCAQSPRLASPSIVHARARARAHTHTHRGACLRRGSRTRALRRSGPKRCKSAPTSSAVSRVCVCVWGGGGGGIGGK